MSLSIKIHEAPKPIPERTLQTVMANLKCYGKPGKAMQNYPVKRRREIFDELERRGWLEPNSINLTPKGNEVAKDWIDLCQESKNEDLDKRSLKNKLYKALKPINGKYYSDENWQVIPDFKKIVNDTLGENMYLEIWCPDGGYRTSKDGYTHWKEYTFEIWDMDSDKNVLNGRIICGAAGTVDDPFSRYDVTISLY